MVSRTGGSDRQSTKSKFAAELAVLGRVLAEIRERSGQKQAEVAARLGLPASYLSKIENGTRRLDVIELIRLAEAIGVEPDAMMREVAVAMRAAR